MSNTEHLLYVEKYRPHTIKDCVLPDYLKQPFQKFVDDGFVPNLLLSGTSGVGKTTVARAMLDEVGCDYIIKNGSLNVDKDSLRNEIASYASSMSMTGGRKYVILDEADYLNPTHVQPALRNFMEEFSKNCGFILTCNYKNKIIEPLHSRCSVHDFKIKGSFKATLAAEFLKRATDILDQEKVEYNKKVVAEVISKFFPDWRRVLNELQAYAASGKIDTGILVGIVDSDIQDLLKALRSKDFKAMRTWVGANASVDTTTLLRRLYDVAGDFIDPKTIPAMVVILADYQYKAAFVVDQEINLAACMTEIMSQCEFVK